MGLLLALLLAAQPLFAGFASAAPVAAPGRRGPIARLGPSVSFKSALAPARMPRAVGLGFAPALPAAPAAVPRILPAPAAVRASVPAGTPGALAPGLSAIASAVSDDVRALPRASSEGTQASGERHVQLLLGAALPSRPEFALAPPSVRQPAVSAPSLGLRRAGTEDRPEQAPPAPVPGERAVRRMMWGTLSFKMTMETMAAAIPLLALDALGGMTSVAILVVGVYGGSQAVSSSFAGALTDRFAPNRILALALAAQGVLSGAMLLAAFTGGLGAGLLYPLYGLFGSAMGIAETARRVIPPLLLGRDEEALRRYNGRLHRYYEVAGVLGAAGAAFLIWQVGAASVLLLTPPAAVLAAWIFWHVPMRAPERKPGGASWLSQYARDIRLGLGTLARDPRLRTVALAMVLPQILHKILENLLAPIFAKKVVGQAALSPLLLAASNLGEFLGATLLLRWASRFKGPAAWVRWGGYGILALWAGFLASILGLGPLGASIVVFAAVLLCSLSWASSHLSLESDIQRRLDEKVQPRVVSLLYGVFVLGSALTSILVGNIFDALPLCAAYAVVLGLCTAVAATVILAARRLARG